MKSPSISVATASKTAKRSVIFSDAFNPRFCWRNITSGMKTIRSLRNFSAVVVIGIACVGILTSCSSPQSITCEKYGQMSYGEKTSTVLELIRAHNLDPASNPVAAAAVSQDIDAYCGIDSVAEVTGGQATATKNLNSPIDNAVNWSQYGG